MQTTMTDESVTKAIHEAAFLIESLREAHAGCPILHSLVLLPLLRRAVELHRDILAYQAATSEE
jgi:hypothetical protein